MYGTFRKLLISLAVWWYTRAHGRINVGLARMAIRSALFVRRRCAMLVVVTLCVFATWNAGQAGYIQAKAGVAQWLLDRSWNKTQQTGERIRPWQWADTWPVARLRLPRQARDMVVLEGASGRNLAFGPAHLSATAMPGTAGNSAIAGHRDTHFAALQSVAPGDPVVLETTHGTHSYEVADVAVVHESDLSVLLEDGINSLTLITCHPFAGVNPGTPWRYVVRARAD